MKISVVNLFAKIAIHVRRQLRRSLKVFRGNFISMDKLIPVINKLQDVFNAVGSEGIDLPQIVCEMRANRVL